MNDALIDPFQVEFIQEELRRNPVEATDRDRELISLYNFQQRLILQWEDEHYRGE